MDWCTHKLNKGMKDVLIKLIFKENLLLTGSAREHINFQWDDNEVRFVLDQQAELNFYAASSLKQQSAGRHVTPLGHIILIPS
jgi:hypothetical protein